MDDSSNSGRMRDSGKTRDEVTLILYECGQRRDNDKRKTALHSSYMSTNRGDRLW